MLAARGSYFANVFRMQGRIIKQHLYGWQVEMQKLVYKIVTYQNFFPILFFYGEKKQDRFVGSWHFFACAQSVTIQKTPAKMICTPLGGHSKKALLGSLTST